jgi:acyl-CoA oxidase
MAVYLHGKEYLDRQEKILEVLQNDETFDKSSVYYLGRTEKFKKGLAKDKRLAELTLELGWNDDEATMVRGLLALCEPQPFSLLLRDRPNI